MEFQTYSDEVFATQSTPGILSLALKKEIPEIQYAYTITWPDEAQLTFQEKKIRVTGRYADPDILQVLSFRLLHGNSETALDEPTSIVISRQTALNLFGKENVLGESIQHLSDETTPYKITGVLADIPEASSIDFDFIIPFEVFRKENPWTTEWGNNGPRTTVKLHENASMEQVTDKIKDFIKQKNEDSSVELFLFPFKDYYLKGSFQNGVQSGGRIVYVRIFVIIAGFILIIACINFMNLATARSARRAKEVGIRKTLGAQREVLIGQFLGESIAISVSSLLVALFLVAMVLPYFNDLTAKEIGLEDLVSWKYLLGLALITIFTGLLSGSYPALYLSSFAPAQVLKGKIHLKSGESLVRKGLVIFQYTLSIALIIATAVIYLQIQYIQNKNLGYNQDNLVYFFKEGNLNDDYELLGQSLSKVPGVTGFAVCSHSFQGRNNNSGGVSWPGKDPGAHILFEMVGTDHRLKDLMEFEISQGRFFSTEYSTDTSAVVINQKALDIMGLEDPIGQTISFWGSDWKIVGVMKDFHFQSVRNDIAPMIMRYDPDFAWFVYIKLNGTNVPATMDQIKEVYNQHNPAYVFDYSFLDEDYARLYTSEIRVGKLSGYFGLFAILISCLGLFGLSSFTAERKTKEIGIRKTLGASFASIIFLMTRDFTRLILISIVIAVPIAFYFMHEWLLDYEFRIDLSWWIFALSGILAMVVAWATISFQSIRAANQNPVNSLKIED